ncbi:MAG: phosphotransferase family protein [Pigmentiphaga sp.]
MAIVSRGHPDPEWLRGRLQDWLREQPGWAGGEVTSLAEASQANGFSNATYRIEMQRQAGGPPTAFILRTPPMETGLFPHYDLGRQFAFMQHLQSRKGVAMAGCRWLETDVSAIGQPFFITDFVAGSVAPDQPNYVKAGWIVDALPSQREAMWWRTLDQLVALAGVDSAGPLALACDWPDRRQPRMPQHLAHWAAIAAWGGAQLPGPADPRLAALRRWLDDHAPAGDPAGVVWGDARFGNIIFRDFEPVALLDWELAAIGDPMIDLSYFLFHIFLTELYHGDDATPERCEGFGDDEASVAYYCARTGRDPGLHGYYWVFNAYRIFCIWQGKAALMHRAGVWSLEEALEARRGDRLWPHVEAVMAGGTEAAYRRREPAWRT